MNNLKKLSYFKQHTPQKEFFLKKDEKKEIKSALKLVLTPQAISCLNK